MGIDCLQLACVAGAKRGGGGGGGGRKGKGKGNYKGLSVSFTSAEREVN